jgi:hypothetical protein
MSTVQEIEDAIRALPDKEREAGPGFTFSSPRAEHGSRVVAHHS